MVLMGYLSDYTGHTKNEMHEIIMQKKFGLEEKQYAGGTYKIRKSASKYLPHGFAGKIDILFGMKKAETEAHRSLRECSDCFMSRRCAMKTGPAHDTPFFFKVESGVGR